ncbi:MAG: DUF4435 domain-containing protein [Thiobacillus sp.]
MSPTEAFVPMWSTEALAARDVFFDEYNDVNFYVEDEEQENLYHLVLGRLFPAIRITQIFPLNGKSNVLAHAKDLSNLSRASRSVYILDKDFDDLLGIKADQNNIFYLQKYCIENFLLDENAFIELAVEAQPRKKREAIRSTIKFPDFLQETVQSLNLLFRLFFVVQALDLGLRNCRGAPELFSVKGAAHIIDPQAVEKYRIEVQEKALQLGKFKTEVEFSNFLDAVFPKNAEKDSNISGKYLLALAGHHVKRSLSWGNVSLDSLTYRLARHSSLLGLESLNVSVKAYLTV